MIAGELDVELCPIGTFAERVRASGAGLGGVITPTGVGTVVEEGKGKLTIYGREYLSEKLLRAEIAVLKVHKAGKFENLVYRRSTCNYNPTMAAATEFVIARGGAIG